jgi:hypothetical protein
VSRESGRRLRICLDLNGRGHTLQKEGVVMRSGGMIRKVGSVEVGAGLDVFDLRTFRRVPRRKATRKVFEVEGGLREGRNISNTRRLHREEPQKR